MAMNTKLKRWLFVIVPLTLIVGSILKIAEHFNVLPWVVAYVVSSLAAKTQWKLDG